MNLLIYLIFTAQSILAQEVEIAIIDSGISKVQAKNIDYKKGFNFVENSNNFPALEKDNNHGTALSSILSGFPQEEREIKVIPIQFADLSKKSLSSHRENYYKALELAINKKVDI